MKKIIAIILMFTAIALSTQLVNAQSPRATERQEVRGSATAENQANNLASLKTRADKMIGDRITSLQKLLTRISRDKKLTNSDKISLINDVNATINNLTLLKAKIDADTDLITARADTKSIVTTYRIFEIYEPKIRLLVTIYNLQTTDSMLTTLSQKIQTLLTKLKSDGKDTTAAQATLDDMNSQLAAVNALLTSDKTLIINVTTQTTSPQSIFVQVRKDLATIRADFAKVRADIAQLRGLLKIIISKGTVTIKPTGATQSAK